jgi:hypothetical protein
MLVVASVLVVLELTKQLPSKCFFVGFSLQSCSHTHTHTYICIQDLVPATKLQCNKFDQFRFFCELWFCSTVGSQGAFH